MFCKLYRLLLVIMMMAACSAKNEKSEGMDAQTVETAYYKGGMPLTSDDFKVPVPQGYDWQITQSWGDHCEECDKKYPEGTSFCEDSHSPKSKFTKYGLDFSLPNDDDKGLPVLASANGTVKDFGITSSWGNFVVLNHGNNICTRYAHMLDESVTVTDNTLVCQGMKLGEIGKTGKDVTGEHLHFQFENCDNSEPLAMFFTDGNGELKCIKDKDIYTDGVYTALKLTNVEKEVCSEEDFYPSNPQPNPPPMGDCSMQCPINSQCANKGQASYEFTDLNGSDEVTYPAINYLWRECAVSGKKNSNGSYSFKKNDKLTRAETLKIALVLFGLDKGCEGNVEPFWDVNPGDWFLPYVICGVKHGIISAEYNGFNPNDEIYFSEAAKIAVEAAVKSGKRKLYNGEAVMFAGVNSNHWAYKYLQTIAHYGGIDMELLKMDPYEKLERGEFARMIAVLSPCYCRKKLCDEGCQCNQASYICEAAEVSKGGDEGGEGQQAGGTGGSGQNDVGSIGASTEDDACYHDESDAGSSGSAGCKPVCKEAGFECGDDGCGGSCGTCPSNMFCDTSKYQQHCESLCVPSCYGRECSVDGCGVSCGTCPSGKFCDTYYGKCKEICVPSCYNHECGGDGCGGSCGTCQGDKWCDTFNGKCQDSCAALSCADVGCECGTCAFCNNITVVCGDCPSGKICVNAKCEDIPCTTSCYYSECGDDGCGGSCGTCPSGKWCHTGAGKCIDNCPPYKSCAEYGCECGTCWTTGPDYCGSISLICGDCPSGKSCVNNKCVADDPCKSCTQGQICVNNKCQADPCYGCPSGQCVDGKCLPQVPQVKKCDPFLGAFIWVYSGYSKAKWVIRAGPYGKQVYYESVGSYGLKFGCDELPVTLLLYEAVSDGNVSGSSGQPPFNVWSPFYYPIPYPSPTYGTEVKVSEFPFKAGDIFLVQIPKF